MELKDFIPPIIGKVSRRRRSLSPLAEYESYSKALEATDTYEDPGIIEVVSLKTKAYRESLARDGAKAVSHRQTLQNLFAFSFVEPLRPLCVLELGGACGSSFFEINHLLPGRIESWSIVETPAMAGAGRQLFQNERLKFFDDLNAAAVSLAYPDLIVAQGVLQYSGNPLETLERLLGLGFKYLYVTRTVVRVCEEGGDAPIFTSQLTDLSAHGPGAVPAGFKDRKSTQPLTIVTKASLASRISKDHQTLFWFEESEPGPMLIGSRRITTQAIGFLAAKRFDL